MSLPVVTSCDPSVNRTYTDHLTRPIGYVVLLILTCSAVLAFFRREPHGAPVTRTLIAPLLGMVGLLAILAIMLLNLDLLAGNSRVVSVVIIVSLIAAFALGPVVGKLLPSSGRQE